jgi:hypothetical protein
LELQLLQSNKQQNKKKSRKSGTKNLKIEKKSSDFKWNIPSILFFKEGKRIWEGYGSFHMIIEPLGKAI